MIFDYIKGYFQPRHKNISKHIDLIKRCYTDRIITKEDAVNNLWMLHTRCRNRAMESYIVKIIKAIDVGHI